MSEFEMELSISIMSEFEMELSISIMSEFYLMTYYQHRLPTVAGLT